MISLFLDDYHIADGLIESFTRLQMHPTMARFRMEQRSRKFKLLNVHNSFIVRTVKRKMNDYLYTSEELQVAEMEAVYVTVDLPTGKSTGTFS